MVEIWDGVEDGTGAGWREIGGGSGLLPWERGDRGYEGKGPGVWARGITGWSRPPAAI